MSKFITECEAVFLDAGGTLLHPYPSVGKIYQEVAARYGCETEHEVLEKLFRKAWVRKDGLSDLQSHADEKKEYAWWKSIVLEVFDQVGGVPKFDDFFEELYQLFGGPEVWRLYPETLEVMAALRETKKQVVIVSNWDSRLFKLCDDFGLSQHVDFILASAVFGAAKPSPKIFEEALRRTDISAERTIHVGDSLGDDIRGASGVGIKGILIDRNGHFDEVSPESAVAKPDLVIRNLKELLV